MFYITKEKENINGLRLIEGFGFIPILKKSLFRLLFTAIFVTIFTSAFVFAEPIVDHDLVLVFSGEESIEELQRFESEIKERLNDDAKNLSLSLTLSNILKALAQRLNGEEQKSKLGEAELVLKKSLELDSQNAVTWHFLGHTQYLISLYLPLELKKSKLFEAEVALRKSLEMKPKNAIALCDLGSILINQSNATPEHLDVNKLNEAEGVLRQSLKLNPNDHNACFRLAVILNKCTKFGLTGQEIKSRLIEAETLLMTIFISKPENVSVMVFLANVLSKLAMLLPEKLGIAEELFKKIININPQLDKDWAFCCLGTVNARQAIDLSGDAKKKKLHDARKALKTALELNPKNANALMILSKLDSL